MKGLLSGRAHGTMRTLYVALGLLAAGAGLAYAAVATILGAGNSEFIGIVGGPARLTARHLVTPAGETTGAWHYHPGYVYNVVTQGTIVVEDGCGQVNSYSAGQAFETSEGRIHRAYNLGQVDAIEYNMFVNPSGRPLTVFTPNNEWRCGPPSTVEECKGGNWARFNHPAPFANQGQCVAYVNGRRRITVLVPEDPIR